MGIGDSAWRKGQRRHAKPRHSTLRVAVVLGPPESNISGKVTLKYYGERLRSITTSTTLIPWTTMAADGLQRRAEATDAMKSWLDLGT